MVVRSPYSSARAFELVPIECCVKDYDPVNDSGFKQLNVTLVANVWTDALTAGRASDRSLSNSAHFLHCTALYSRLD